MWGFTIVGVPFFGVLMKRGSYYPGFYFGPLILVNLHVIKLG